MAEGSIQTHKTSKFTVEIPCKSSTSRASSMKQFIQILLLRHRFIRIHPHITTTSNDPIDDHNQFPTDPINSMNYLFDCKTRTKNGKPHFVSSILVESPDSLTKLKRDPDFQAALKGQKTWVSASANTSTVNTRLIGWVYHVHPQYSARQHLLTKLKTALPPDSFLESTTHVSATLSSTPTANAKPL